VLARQLTDVQVLAGKDFLVTVSCSSTTRKAVDEADTVISRQPPAC
jgi:hypothetical protein